MMKWIDVVKLWTLLCFYDVFLDLPAATPFLLPDVHFRPSVRYLTIWESESQQIDCYITYTERNCDLRWTMPSSPQRNCTVEDKTEDNGNGTFTIYSRLNFKSFIPSDAGIYTCTFRPNPYSASQGQMKLTVQKVCEVGKYGLGCTSSCSEFCKEINTPGKESPCNYKNGHCLHGCLPGYRGANCSSVCGAGKYGLGCSSSCSEFCKEINTPGKESPCNYKDGHCLHGCLPGYRGANCSSVCGHGRYGPDCSLTCSAVCKNYGSVDKSWCHPETGICVDGCQDGYTGKYCTTYTGEYGYTAVVALSVGVGCSLACVFTGVFIFSLNIIRRERKRMKTGLTENRQSRKNQQETGDRDTDEEIPLN